MEKISKTSRITTKVLLLKTNTEIAQDHVHTVARRKGPSVVMTLVRCRLCGIGSASISQARHEGRCAAIWGRILSSPVRTARPVLNRLVITLHLVKTSFSFAHCLPEVVASLFKVLPWRGKQAACSSACCRHWQLRKAVPTPYCLCPYSTDGRFSSSCDCCRTAKLRCYYWIPLHPRLRDQ